jgi:hypothetical protein
MKLKHFGLLLMGISLFSSQVWSKASLFNGAELTDNMAIEEGMTLLDVSSDPIKNLISEASVVKKSDIEEAIQKNKLVIVVNKSKQGTDPNAQSLKMFEDGKLIYQTLISTGREQNELAKSGRRYFSTTPTGFFRAKEIYTKYYSQTWKADMPNPVFFIGGIAIHATSASHYKELGSRASGGCVRMKLEESQFVREKVMDSGMGKDNFKGVPAGYRRTLVTQNKVKVPAIDRNTGIHTNKTIDSWDTVIIVYQ